MYTFEELVSTVVDQFENATTEQHIIDYLEKTYAPEEHMVVEGDFADACTALLPVGYQKGWYELCGWIYGTGYGVGSGPDPLCEQVHPLVFAAKEKNHAFAKCYIRHQKRFEYLNYDNVYYFEGCPKTLPELIVEADCPAVMEVCLQNGMNPNSFCADGRHLLEAAVSEEMRALLEKFGGVKADVAQRNLVRVFYQSLYQDCVTEQAADALFSPEPLMELAWCNGYTPGSQKLQANLMHIASKGCYLNLLKGLMPYMQPLSDDRRLEILQFILEPDPWGDYRPHFDRPGHVVEALELLAENGFRCSAGTSLTDNPIVKSLDMGMLFTKAFCPEFRLRICKALHIITDVPSVPPDLFSSAMIAYLLEQIDRGDEQAVDLYLEKLAKSKWYETGGTLEYFMLPLLPLLTVISENQFFRLVEIMGPLILILALKEEYLVFKMMLIKHFDPERVAQVYNTLAQANLHEDTLRNLRNDIFIQPAFLAKQQGKSVVVKAIFNAARAHDLYNKVDSTLTKMEKMQQGILFEALLTAARAQDGAQLDNLLSKHKVSSLSGQAGVLVDAIFHTESQEDVQIVPAAKAIPALQILSRHITRDRPMRSAYISGDDPEDTLRMVLIDSDKWILENCGYADHYTAEECETVKQLIRKIAGR